MAVVAERWRRVAGGQPHVDGVPAEALGLERGHGPAAKGAAGGGKELMMTSNDEDEELMHHI